MTDSRDTLLEYYERELSFLRRMGAAFATRYPKVASRLELEATKCDDPHVERLLEGFAFLTGRVQLKLDDEFPEITQALLNVVCPQYVRPMPSMSLVEFQLDPEQGKLTTGLTIPRDTVLYSREVADSDGLRCKFRSCYDTTLWPVTVAAAEWTTPDRLRPSVKSTDASAALRLELRCAPDVTFAALGLATLRLHLHGDGTLATMLYELLDNNCIRILVRDPTPGSKMRPIELPPSALQPVGFAETEALLPYPGRAFLGYRLLQEYFAFPAKFLFFDLSGFDAARAADAGAALEIVFLIAPFERAERQHLLETRVDATTVRLGCTPVVNLFAQASEPILLTHTRHEYPLVADVRRRDSTEVFSVDDVVAVTPGASEPLRFAPFYAFRHGTGRSRPQAFWYATRRSRLVPRQSGTEGSESAAPRGADLWLSFVDLSGRTAAPSAAVVTARITCFNGDLPSRLPLGSDRSDFELQGGGPIKRVVALVKPTAAAEPPLGTALLWRLISQLSLNYLSLVDGGPEPLQELLRLYTVGDRPAAGRQIDGIVSVRSAPAFARLLSEHGLTFARGRRVEVEFDEELFAGASAYLFASVLERFLGLYSSMNSFSILAARTRQRTEVLREWQPRAGWRPLT